MPAVGVTLGTLIMQKMRQKFRDISNFTPDGSQNPQPHHFQNFCMGIGKGIANGTPTIKFTTADSGLGGSPLVGGAGTGTGIKVNDSHMSQLMYTNVRNKILERFGRTTHSAWPPSDEDFGRWLKAITDSISESVKDHYGKAWILTSAHPNVYLGTGNVIEGGFSGIQSSAVTGAILSETTGFNGEFWPVMAEQIAISYVESIHSKATAIVTIAGACVPGGGQVCGLPLTGAGTGVAS